MKDQDKQKDQTTATAGEVELTEEELDQAGGAVFAKFDGVRGKLKAEDIPKVKKAPIASGDLGSNT